VTALALFRQRHAREAALAAVCAILFLTFLDNTIVSVALADIQSSLSVSVSGLQWVVDGYMLAFAALMLTGGTLGDLFGRKKVMLTGVVIFCAGSVVAAVAPSIAVFTPGYRNRFGHPRAEVVARYARADARLCRTDLDGAVMLTFGPDVTQDATVQREVQRRYWYDPPRASPAPLE